MDIKKAFKLAGIVVLAASAIGCAPKWRTMGIEDNNGNPMVAEEDGKELSLGMASTGSAFHSNAMIMNKSGKVFKTKEVRAEEFPEDSVLTERPSIVEQVSPVVGKALEAGSTAYAGHKIGEGIGKSGDDINMSNQGGDVGDVTAQGGHSTSISKGGSVINDNKDVICVKDQHGRKHYFQRHQAPKGPGCN